MLWLTAAALFCLPALAVSLPSDFAWEHGGMLQAYTGVFWHYGVLSEDGHSVEVACYSTAGWADL
jgi:hypothetical protein